MIFRHIRFTSPLFMVLVALLVIPTAGSQTLKDIDSGLDIMTWQNGEVLRDEALVQFKEGVSALERFTLHRDMGCDVIETVAPGLERIRLNGKPLNATLEAYNNASILKYAEPHRVYRTFYTPNDSDWSLQWGPANMNCPEAWDIHKGAPDTTVAILDSSVDYNHGDLAGNYKYGYDFFNGDSDPYDFLDFIGHGTHCSGIAAAVTDNAKGIAGVGFDCSFAFYQVGSIIIISDSAVIQAINDVISKGWHVISMSFGGSQSSQSMKTALDNAYNAGVVCVAAAGNDGNTNIMYPGGYPNVISVASHNQANQKSSFSTYGNWVDVSAPGENIYSTIYTFWGSYTTMDGTSMACPHVAGMCNILYSLIGGQRNKANADLIRNAVQDTAIPASWVIHGRVDLEGAMKQLMATNPPTITAVNPSQVQAFQGGTVTITGTDFTNASQVLSGGIVLLPPEFTIVNDTTITYSAPTATALGAAQVIVTNPAGDSNPGTFTYVETDPPKLGAPAFTQSHDLFTWFYGGGVNDFFLLNVGTNNTTFPYQGFDILAPFTTIHSGYLDAVGLGSLQVTIPNGLQGLSFHSQVLTANPKFKGATNISTTLITN